MRLCDNGRTHLVSSGSVRDEIVDRFAKVHKLVEGVRGDNTKNLLHFFVLRRLTNAIVLQDAQALQACERASKTRTRGHKVDAHNILTSSAAPLNTSCG